MHKLEKILAVFLVSSFEKSNTRKITGSLPSLSASQNTPQCISQEPSMSCQCYPKLTAIFPMYNCQLSERAHWKVGESCRYSSVVKNNFLI